MKNNSTLDLTENIFCYPDSFKNIYFNLNIKLRKKFTIWIDVLSRENSCMDWWISIPATRNSNNSNLFHIYCVLETLKILKTRNQLPKKIVVNERSLYDLLKKIIPKRQIIKITIKNSILISYIKNKIIFFKSIFFHLFLFIISRLCKKKKLGNSKSIVLIDTFCNSTNFNEHRYYGKDFIKKIVDKKNVFLVPTFIQGQGLFNIIRMYKACNKKNFFIMKEHYLSFFDLIYSFLYFLRRKKLKNNFIKLNGVDYSNLINEELKKNNFFSSQIISQLNFNFFKNLKTKYLFDVRKSINWFENQIIDKGWNFGFRTFFPKSISIGYQGFTSLLQYMCTNPSVVEEEKKIIPKKILVIGKAFVKSRKEFNKNLDISVGPALSYQYLHNNKLLSLHHANRKKILIVLSGFIEDDVSLVEWLIRSKIQNFYKFVYFKCHPILDFKKLSQLTNTLPKNFVETKNSLLNSITTSENIISCGPTSAQIEIIAAGRFLIVPVLNKCDVVNLKNLNINKNNYKLVYTEKSLKNILDNKNNKIVKNFKNKILFFNQINKKNLDLFF